MKLLPPEIAFHYHALPIATDGKQVTVAMASPEDRKACRVVQSIIDAPLCVIQADSHEIDLRLNRLWPEVPPRMKFLYWPISTESEKGWTFAEIFSTLLGADLIKVENQGLSEKPSHVLEIAIRQDCPDLIIVQAVHPARAMRCLFSCPSINTLDCLTDFLILPSEPILPIKKVLLLLLNNDGGFATAASWVVRMSQSNRIKTVVLPVMPQIPLCYGSFLRHEMDNLVNGEDQLGRRMRSISDILSTGNIEVSYRLRDGGPLDQIRDEIQLTKPDLIIVPSSSRKGLKKRESVDLVNVLIKCVTIPVLIA